ncbi:MAG TPA: type II toxin-antitoxin system prevent-host-death family antitoxin [Gaiellaceae bacterium]|jgi:prevent-host-death family protein|nr:type II toxin-antitoxin system prevent-host-death family antitoxin [Gaiellaceae bacterium]
MAKMTATEVARRFSEVLNRVSSGEEIEVTRAGAPIAVIAPPKLRVLSAERFRELLASAPPVDDAFADDVRELRRSVGPPEAPAWPS